MHLESFAGVDSADSVQEGCWYLSPREGRFNPPPEPLPMTKTPLPCGTPSLVNPSKLLTAMASKVSLMAIPGMM